ncbi:MAG TPA: hypothetical protein VIM69_07330 [Opitutaceae bacterium]
MKPYTNRSGKAGVVGYEYGDGWITLQFARGAHYTYSAAKIGKTNLAKMKRLADAGEGLTTFINTHSEVKNGYTKE